MLFWENTGSRVSLLLCRSRPEEEARSAIHVPCSCALLRPACTPLAEMTSCCISAVTSFLLFLAQTSFYPQSSGKPVFYFLVALFHLVQCVSGPEAHTHICLSWGSLPSPLRHDEWMCSTWKHFQVLCGNFCLLFIVCWEAHRFLHHESLICLLRKI